MTLFFGLLALLQSMLIPGLIVKKIFFERVSFLSLLPFIFAFSLIFTWIMIFGLTKFELYLKPIFLLLILFECLICIYIYRNINLSKPLFFEIDFSKFSFLRSVNFIFVIFIFIIFFHEAGNIYTQYDSIVSYNGRWARSWYQNEIPINAGLYPQLLTANMSLSNVLIGLNTAEMQFFSYILCLSFVPITSLVAGPLAKHFSDERIYLANIIFISLLYLPIKTFPSYYNTVISMNGYMDIPVTCFVIISIGLFILGWSYTKNKNKNNYGTNLILMSAVVAAGAAATKQSGLTVTLLAYPAILYWAYYFKVSIIKTLIKLFLIQFTIFGLWYAQTFYQIYVGLSWTNFNIIDSNFSHLDGYISRAQAAFGKFPEFFFISLVGLLAITIPRYRWLAIPILPGLIIWSVFNSYDYRNFLHIYPFLAIGSAAIFYFIFSKVGIFNQLLYKLEQKITVKIILLAIKTVLIGYIIWSLFNRYDYTNYLQYNYPFLAIALAALFYLVFGKASILNQFPYKLEQKITVKIEKKLLISSMIVVSIFTLLITNPSDKKLYEENEYKRRFIMPISYTEAIYNAWDSDGIGRIITTRKWYIARLPKMIPGVVEPFDFELNTNENNDYFESLVNSSDADYILISSHPYLQPNKIITSKIHNFLINNTIRLVAEEDDVLVYKINK